jgi:transcriptional regulator with XRE-family HTH domain
MATPPSRKMLPFLQTWPSRASARVAITAHMMVRAQLHKHLTAWRKLKGLSQEQVGNILGIDKSTVHRWETGKRAMDLDDIQRLADLYNVDPIALLMSPDDVELAQRLVAAKTILERVSPEAADRWLATGADITST